MRPSRCVGYCHVTQKKTRFSTLWCEKFNDISNGTINPQGVRAVMIKLGIYKGLYIPCQNPQTRERKQMTTFLVNMDRTA